MHLTKHHGLGNDFLVALVDAVPDGAADLARSWCHRTTGIGADGLIFGTPPTPSDGAVDLVMTLFNADGSAAEISGNGIRCLAQAAFAQRPGTATLAIATGGGVRVLELVSAAGATAQVSVSMGPVGDGPALVDAAALARPTFSVLRAETAEVGNPHIVLQVDDLDAVDPAVDGPAIEALYQPEGINVHFLRSASGDHIELVHWERGAGVTAACGSGATVSATIANAWGMAGTTVDVHMPGGAAQVVVGADATLIGPAVHIADIEIEIGGDHG